MKAKILFLILSIFAASGWAQGVGTSTEKVQGDISRQIPSGWVPYLGMNVGSTQSNPNLDVEGVPSSIKVIGSYYLLNTAGVFDLGVGAMAQSFSEDGALEENLSTTVMELGARYQTESRWQMGVVYNQFFDKGPNYGANQGDVGFAGLQVMKEFGFADTYLARFGARYMTSVNVDDENLNMAYLDLQIGWNTGRKYSSGYSDTYGLAKY